MNLVILERDVCLGHFNPDQLTDPVKAWRVNEHNLRSCVYLYKSGFMLLVAISHSDLDEETEIKINQKLNAHFREFGAHVEGFILNDSRDDTNPVSAYRNIINKLPRKDKTNVYYITLDGSSYNLYEDDGDRNSVLLFDEFNLLKNYLLDEDPSQDEASFS